MSRQEERTRAVDEGISDVDSLSGIDAEVRLALCEAAAADLGQDARFSCSCARNYLRDGLPEENELVVMRPAEAPDPTAEELTSIRAALSTPELMSLREEVESAGSDGERRAALVRFNRTFQVTLSVRRPPPT